TGAEATGGVASGAVVGGAVCMMLLVGSARPGDPAPQRSVSASREAPGVVRERRNRARATTITSTIAATETSRNQLPKRSRKSGSQAPALRSKASRKAKPKDAIASSSAKPTNSGVRGASPGIGSPG